MKALVFNRETTDWDTSRGFELADVPEPSLDEQTPGDTLSVIIKVYYAGVCGSDRGIWYRQSFKDQILESLSRESQPYRIIGHEFFGQIVEMGSQVSDRYGLTVNDFVSAESHLVCERCPQCRAGQKNVCTNETIIGISHQGCFAEFIKIPGHVVWKTDTKKIRPEIAAIQEPFGNAVHAASKVDVSGKTVALFGLGPIGLFAVPIIRRLGAATIIGIEPNPVSREMALKLGIDYCIPLSQGAPSQPYAHDAAVVNEVLSLTGGFGVDVSFEMAGFNSSVNNAIASTRRGGDVILFGIKAGNFTIEHYDRMIVRGLTLHSVIGREVFRTWEKTRSLLEDAGNKIQENLYNIILQQGDGTILPICEYTEGSLEDRMHRAPKLLLQF